MKIDLCSSSPNLCSGCGACAAICPQKAISMVFSPEDFLYPEIDAEKCVQCGLCMKVCDFKQFVPTGKKPKCYAVRHKDMNEVNTSRSGGFFMALCKYVTENHGIVFGCEIDEQLYIVHKYQEVYEKCKRFKGSKYVQSDLRNTFLECAEFLRQGKLVLFSGTGCQIHSLLRFLICKNVPTENLITVDLVCHGTPSPGVWSNFLRVLERRERNAVLTVDFRDKSEHGWVDHIEKYVFANGETKYIRKWTNVFYRHILFRESCHSCKYTTVERNSDYTIGDYWGIQNNAPKFDDNKGCSLVLVHTEKGYDIFEKIISYINYSETELLRSMQPQLSRPIWKGWDRKLFWALYKIDKQRAVEIWFFPSAAVKITWKLEKVVKRLIKKLLRR